MSWLILSLLLATAPATDDSGGSQPILPDYDLTQLRMELKDFDRTSEAIYYSNDAYGTNLDSELIYQMHPGLWTDSRAVKLVQNELAKENNLERKKVLGNLLKAVSDIWLWRKVSPIDDEILNSEASITVKVGSTDFAYRDLEVKSYNEKDPIIRKQFYYAGLNVVQNQLNPLYLQKENQLSLRAKELGYKNFADYYEKTKGYDFIQWDKDCRIILDKTNPMMKMLTLEELHAALPGRTPQSIMPWDRESISRHSEYDKYFPKDRLISFFKQVMTKMGIDLDQYPNIWIDAGDRPTKGGRPATYVVVVPNDIRVNIKLYGGATDYSSVFHEMGHALHYANTKVPDYELQAYGDGGLTEAYAFLMESLLGDPIFLEEELGMPHDAAREWARISLLGNLSSFRYYCRDFLYENYLHRDKPKPEDYYFQLAQKDKIYPVLRESVTYSYLTGDEQFYGIYYLEAWYTSAVLADYLENNYGRRWWNDKRLGDFLRGLWAQGEEISCQDLCAQLGVTKFSPDVALARMMKMERDTRK